MFGILRVGFVTAYDLNGNNIQVYTRGKNNLKEWKLSFQKQFPDNKISDFFRMQKSSIKTVSYKIKERFTSLLLLSI